MKITTKNKKQTRPSTLALLISTLLLVGTILGSAGLARAQDPIPAAPNGTPLMPVPNRPMPAQTDEAAELAEAVPAVVESDTTPDVANATTTIRLPVVQREHYYILADRIGFGTNLTNTVMYPETRKLNAGWYVDWRVRTNPPRPAGIEFVQMVRVHQKINTSIMYNSTTKCGIGITADRTICPYASPAAYETMPSLDVIRTAAKRNPGSVWLIGNEMDRPDWGGALPDGKGGRPKGTYGGRQDEITPALYAKAYHDLYLVIKGEDPTARIAIGGMIQFTPLREEYLNKIWASYKQLYPGYTMPVDIWNIHNFIGSEICTTEKLAGRNEYYCYGMGVPPGASTITGAYVGQDNKHTDKVTFDAQIRGFRKWMADHGQKNKPLIVSEYGVLYPSLCGDNFFPTPELKQKCKDDWNLAGGYVDYENPQVVHDFMLWSFDYFANTKDCALSGVDDCRLVQRWAWFGLEDVGWDFNTHGALMIKNSGTLTQAGLLYSNFSHQNWEKLRYE